MLIKPQQNIILESIGLNTLKAFQKMAGHFIFGFLFLSSSKVFQLNFGCQAEVFQLAHPWQYTTVVRQHVQRSDLKNCQNNKQFYMKQVFFLIAIISLILFSCKKTNSVDLIPTSLNGKWRMILVKDNASGLTTTKPSSIQGDVDITFTSITMTNGTFVGNTPTNDILKNNYSIGANQSITIPVLAMTKVGETSWGILFVDNVCSSQEYNFEIGGKLSIKTTNKTLTFRKL